MATYHLRIDLDNAAFHDDDDNFNGAELGRILRELAEAAEAYDVTSIDDDAAESVMDWNGNRVGRVWTTR